MTFHPREGGPRRSMRRGIGLSRREFMKRAGLAAGSLPLASAVLASCGKPPVDGRDATGQAFARPDRPVTLPLGAVEPIPDGLKPEEGPLEIYNWAEYLNPRVVKLFEERYGVKVNVNTFINMAEGITALTNTETNFDLFFPTPDLIGKLANGGQVRPLTKSYLPNLANVWDSLAGVVPDKPYYDVGAQYSVPYTVYTTGIGWRTDEVSMFPMPGPSEDEIPGLANPYDIFWDPKYRDAVHILDDYREAIAMVLLRSGVSDVNTDDDATRARNLQTASRDLIALRGEMNAKADITEYIDLPEGQSLIHQEWSGDMTWMRYYLPKNVEHTEQFRYWWPETGGVIGNDLMVVMAGGKNPVLAHLFIDHLLGWNPGNAADPGGGLVNFSWLGYVPPMKDYDVDDLVVGRGPWSAGRIVPPSLVNTIPVEADFERGVTLDGLAPDVEGQWQDAWELFRAG